MPLSPYPVSGSVTDVGGGTTNLPAIKVTAYNKTQNEWLKSPYVGTVSSIGEYTIDLGNLVARQNNDVIFLVFFFRNSDGETIKHAEYRFTVSEAAGQTSQNAVMHPGTVALGPSKILSVAHANSTGGGLYVSLYDRRNDIEILQLEAPAGDTRGIVWPRGKKFFEGLGIIYESDTDGSSFASVQVESATGN